MRATGNWSKTAPMQHTRPQGGQSGTVHSRPIPFMSSEIIARMTIVLLRHPTIARDLGNDRGGGDRQRASVAVWNPTLRKPKLRKREEVEKHEVRLNAQMPNGPR